MDLTKLEQRGANEWLVPPAGKMRVPAIIYATEPVFAALFSLFFFGEPLGPRDILGGGLIFAGILIAEFRPASPQNNSNK